MACFFVYIYLVLSPGHCRVPFVTGSFLPVPRYTCSSQKDHRRLKNRICNPWGIEKSVKHLTVVLQFLSLRYVRLHNLAIIILPNVSLEDGSAADSLFMSRFLVSMMVVLKMLIKSNRFAIDKRIAFHKTFAAISLEILYDVV